ncbi:MAG: glutathione S-transferase N-terminal domain-containing protein [Polyangiales bacterium]
MRPYIGNNHLPTKRRPEKPLELYEFEACPFCRKAREALSALSITVIIKPCPRNGPTFRKEVLQRTGQEQFPYLIDPNTNVSMFESSDIVRYLFDTYGADSAPWTMSSDSFATATSSLASASRFGRGMYYRPARKPEEMLELYSFEGSPYCRIVREVLCEFEIPYLLHNVPKGSPDRASFVERSGKMQVPYLVDSNTGIEMFESEDIILYLTETYAENTDEL